MKGPGGIGKSTLTTRTAANLGRKGYEFIVVQGDTTIEQILEAVSKKAALLGVKDAENVYAADVGPNEKLAWYLDQFLLKQKVVIILDNFEENQDEARAGEFKRERLKKFSEFFRDSLKHHDTFLMFSTRYTLPGFDSPDITINIPEFRPVEFRKMLLNRKALKRLDSQSIKTLRQEIGGNPRALELLDRIAYEEFKQRDFTWEQLKDLLPEMRERIIEKKGKGDEFTPLFLERLLGYLSEAQRLLLDILAIYRNPVPVEAVTAHKVSMKREDRRKLGDLSLLECIDLEDNDLYYVHRLTAQYLLEQMKAAERKRYHKKAARYFEGIRTEEGEKYLDNDIEARWHYIQAVQWNKAAEITFRLEDYLSLRGYPQWAMELLTELELPKIKEEYKGEVHNRIGILFVDIFGEYEKALSHYRKALEINEKIDNIKGVSASLHQIGRIYQERGDYEAALMNYQQSLEIRKKIGDIKGLAESMGQMGILNLEQNQFEAALKFFIQAFQVFVKIGSPYANLAKDYISKIKEKLPEDTFNAILEEFNLKPDVFDKEDAEDKQKKFNEFLIAITKEAVYASASEKSSEEKEKLAAQLNQFIEQLPDAPEAQGIKSYFQLLLAAVKGEDHRKHLENLPNELKELFEKTVEEIGE
ncbi:MAG: tetratricopeptide repeat protein [Candidatus Aminicenantes bacterium]|nr:tetratricopeptide repeat protein [Candidatus Aminicenantes bacterium]